jgi:hypothetical protein
MERENGFATRWRQWELRREVVAGGIKGVGNLLAHNRQNRDHDERDQGNKQTVLHQCLPLFLNKKPLNHLYVTSSNKEFDGTIATPVSGSNSASDVGFSHCVVGTGV